MTVSSPAIAIAIGSTIPHMKFNSSGDSCVKGRLRRSGSNGNLESLLPFAKTGSNVQFAPLQPLAWVRIDLSPATGVLSGTGRRALLAAPKGPCLVQAACSSSIMGR